MAIGTKQIKLEQIRNNQLKLSNIKAVQVKRKETNIFLNILKAIGIVLVSSILGAVGQSWTAPFFLNLGWSEIASATTSAFIGSSIEFTTLMGYDALTDQVSSVNSVLNLLVFSKVLKSFSMSRKMDKALIQADNFGILKKLHIDSRKINTYTDLLKVLNGKKFAINQTIYDFTQGVTKSDVLHLFANWTTTESISKISKMSKTTEGIVVENVEELIKFQNLLLEINPGLFPKIDSGYFKQVTKILKDRKIRPKDLLNNEIFANLVLTIRTTSGNISGNMIWALYSLRMTKEIDKQLTNSLVKMLKTGRKVLSIFDVPKFISKLLNKTLNALLNPIKRTIDSTKTKIFKATEKKLDPFLKKWNESIFKNFGKITYESADKLLIPIDSEWLFAYRVKPLINATYVVQIYFKNSKYEPRIFYWNVEELSTWIKACETQTAGEFYKENLELGYHLKSSGFLLALNFLPAAVAQFVKEGIKIYRQIKKIKGEIENIKDLPGKMKKNALNTLNKNITNYIFAIGFSSVFFRRIFKNWAMKKSNVKYIETMVIFRNKRKVLKKIRRI